MPGISAAGNTGDRRHGLAAAAADLVAKQAAGDTTGHGAETAAFPFDLDFTDVGDLPAGGAGGVRRAPATRAKVMKKGAQCLCMIRPPCADGKRRSCTRATGVSPHSLRPYNPPAV